MKMLRFQIFKEDVQVDDVDSNISFDYKKSRDRNSEFIDTRLGKSTKKIKFTPRITTLKTSRSTVYSAYSKKASKDTTDILKSIKKSTGYKYNLSDEEYLYFIKRTSIFFNKVLSTNPLDTILIMESSSPLIGDVVNELIKRLPHSNIKVHSKGIEKNIDTLTLERPDKISDKEFSELERFLEKSKHEGKFEVKKVHPKYRAFFKNWISIDKYIHKDIINKNVVIFDDYITTGSTLDVICNQLIDLNANSLKVMTILKG